MTTRHAVLLAVACTLGTILTTASLSQETAARRTVKLASLEYPPYASKSLPGGGYVTEVIIAALSESGLAVDVKQYPWARALKMAKSGKVDGLFTIWHRKEREEWFLFSAPLPPNHVGFFKRKVDDISFSKLEDLKPYKIGVVRGYANPPEFEAAKFLTKKESKDDAQNIAKLLAGRIDLALIDRGLAQHVLKTQFAKQAAELEWIEPALEVIPQHVVFSKAVADHEMLQRVFDRGLAKIRENGKLAEILKRHDMTLEDY